MIVPPVMQQERQDVRRESSTRAALDPRRAPPATTLRGGLDEQLGQPPAERGGVGQRASLGEDGLAMQQLRVAPEALVVGVGRVEGHEPHQQRV